MFFTSQIDGIGQPDTGSFSGKELLPFEATEVQGMSVPWVVVASAGLVFLIARGVHGAIVVERHCEMQGDFV